MNETLFLSINSWAGQNQWLDHIMIFSAEWLGYFLVLLLLAPLLATTLIRSNWLLYVVRSVLLKWSYYKDMLIVAFGSAIISRFIFVNLIRIFYYNPRPFLVLETNQLINHETTSSFPSGHAAFYFALAAGVYLYNKKAGWLYFATAGLMGFARVFGGVHWPLDIIAGGILGISVSLSLRSVILKSFQKLSKLATGSAL